MGNNKKRGPHKNYKPKNTHPPSSRWCLLRDNELVKSAVKSRMMSYGYNVSSLSEATGVARSQISTYLNYDHYSNNSTSKITQKSLLDLTEFLNIEVELNVGFKAISDENRRTPVEECRLTRAKWRPR